MSFGDIEFAYDAGGIRKSKTLSDGYEYRFYTEGNVIHKEHRGYSVSPSGGARRHATLRYHYDGAGVCGIESSGVVYHVKKNLQGDVVMLVDGRENVRNRVVAKYVYDAWGNHKIYNSAGTEIYDSVTGTVSGSETHIGILNPFRYRGSYFDADIRLYYLQTRYYDPQVGRFINADSVDYADPESLNGLNLYAYSGNDPVNGFDSDGNKPKWWQWALSGALLVVGVALCATGVGSGLGVGLAVAGGSMMASNIMEAAGVDGKVASIVSAGLDIVAGIALCATGIGGGLGASLIASGVGSLAGGFISEAMGYSFETGAMIGGIVGGIAGGKVYNKVHFSKIAKQGVVIGKSGQYDKVAKQLGMAHYDGLPGFKQISKISKPLANKMGWAHNKNYLKQVMKYNGTIVDIGGPLTGAYAKEVNLIGRYKNLKFLF